MTRRQHNELNALVHELAIAGKRFELLHELAPSAAVIAFLANPKNASITEVETEALRTAGRSLGVELRILNASNSNEIDAAFTTLAKDHPVPLVVSADALFPVHPGDITAWSIETSD
jgi:putative ABC transport system substrate-binding protein